ncbi:MAG: hypothetical protein AAGH15_25465 [Myxococcota bacterium]
MSLPDLSAIDAALDAIGAPEADVALRLADRPRDLREVDDALAALGEEVSGERFEARRERRDETAEAPESPWEEDFPAAEPQAAFASEPPAEPEAAFASEPPAEPEVAFAPEPEVALAPEAFEAPAEAELGDGPGSSEPAPATEAEPAPEAAPAFDVEPVAEPEPSFEAEPEIEAAPVAEPEAVAEPATPAEPPLDEADLPAVASRDVPPPFVFDDAAPSEPPADADLPAVASAPEPSLELELDAMTAAQEPTPAEPATPVEPLPSEDTSPSVPPQAALREEVPLEPDEFDLLEIDDEESMELYLEEVVGQGSPETSAPPPVPPSARPGGPGDQALESLFHDLESVPPASGSLSEELVIPPPTAKHPHEVDQLSSLAPLPPAPDDDFVSIDLDMDLDEDESSRTNVFSDADIEAIRASSLPPAAQLRGDSVVGGELSSEMLDSMTEMGVEPGDFEEMTSLSTVPPEFDAAEVVRSSQSPAPESEAPDDPPNDDDDKKKGFFKKLFG